jgi:putative nucleotidyltransferase with HDIG domain
MTAAAQLPLPPGAGDVDADGRIQHLFRGARREGRIHPLQHLVQRYRQGAGSATAAVPLPAPGPLPAACAPIDGARLHRCLRQLPALPQAALQALGALRDDGASAERCAELIGHDQALAARALRLANSAFYGVPGRVGSLRDAVQLLGRRPLASLLTLATVAAQFDARSCPPLSFAGFWRHAIATALAAHAIARALSRDEDQAFTVGLLHDIGRLALAVHFPAQTAVALAHAREVDRGQAEVEHQLLGTDHQAVGAQVAAQWSFPPEVVQALAEHHAPQPVGAGVASLADIVHLADAVAHALDLARDPHDIVPVLDPNAWDRLALATRALPAIFGETEAGVAELAQLMGL